MPGKRPWWIIPQQAKAQAPKASQQSPRKDVHIKAPSASAGGTATK